MNVWYRRGYNDILCDYSSWYIIKHSLTYNASISMTRNKVSSNLL